MCRWISLRFVASILSVATLAVAQGGCATDVPLGERFPLLIVAPEPARTNAAVERLLPKISGYLRDLSGGHAVELVRLAPSSTRAVAALARERQSGLLIVVDSYAIAGGHLGPLRVDDLAGDAYRLRTERVGDHDNGDFGGSGATIVWTDGRTPLGKQYAIYEVLRRLGARFYHPEQHFLPRNPLSQLRERAETPTVLRPGDDGVTFAPDYRHRGFSFHGAHPLEHLESLSDASHPITEAVNVNDWIVKNFGDDFRGASRGVASAESRAKRAAELDALRRVLGMRTGAGISLHNQQQGATGVIDPSKPTPVKKQIEDYVTARLAASPQAASFGIHFGPTELTTTPDKQTVDWINWAGRKALELRPDIRVVVNNHITGSQATDNYSDLGCPPGTNDKGTIDYYDLAFHVDKRFAARVHTVMFYPLEGPAQVYNQKTFTHKLCLMKKASAAGRPLVWFPEGSWWLSFDNTIPVYLPLYIWTRWRDIKLIEPLLIRNGGTLYHHRMFTSGHEWGYWQQDYAVGLLGWSSKLSLDDVLGELFDPLCKVGEWKGGCAARSEAIAVMKEMINHQRQYLLTFVDYRGRPGGLFAYLSGEDPADEIGAATGLEFQPVRVSFNVVLGWSKSQLSTFRGGDLSRLKKMDAAYEGYLKRLRAIEGDVPEAGRTWLAEVIDGIENNMLRARHTHQLYEAVLVYREQELVGASTDDAAKAARPHFDAAQKTLDAARVVIRRREQSYRYPLLQIIGGGDTPETAVPNGTTYPWRLHYKTHAMTYWTNRHDKVKALLDGTRGADQLSIEPVFGAPGAKTTLRWPTLKNLKSSVTIDGKAVTPSDTTVDLGAGERVVRVDGSIEVGGQKVATKGALVRSTLLSVSKDKGFTLAKPSSPVAQTVLEQIFPRMRLARVRGAGGADLGSIAFGPELNGKLRFDGVAVAAVAKSTATTFTTAPQSLTLPVPSPSGVVAATVSLEKLVLSGALAADGKLTGTVKMVGEMVLADLVKALIELAGFDEKGAYQTLGDVLGFDPKSPPRALAFEGTLALQ